MKPFELTFRFDDEENSLSRFNGLPLADLAKFLSALSKSVTSKNSDKIVLSEIKGNCYAPVISTTSKTQIETIKTLHTEIAQNNINGLNSSEKAYYNTLRDIMRNDLSLNVYDHDKSFYKIIEKLAPVVHFPYFNQTNAYRGLLTRIGSRNLNSRNTVFISSYAHEIQIDDEQDHNLRKFYKNALIEFYITEKINKETGRTEEATLDDFEVLKDNSAGSFLKSVDFIRENHGAYFSDTLIQETNE